MTHALVQLAYQALKSYLTNGQIVVPPSDLEATWLSSRAGVFVSLHQTDGSLRGCIGTIEPVYENIATEVIYNAIAAATQDPRFPPVSLGELPETEISVDV